MGTSGVFQKWVTINSNGKLSFPSEMKVRILLGPPQAFGTGAQSKWIRPPKQTLSISLIGQFPWGSALYQTNQGFEALSGSSDEISGIGHYIEFKGNEIQFCRAFESNEDLQPFIITLVSFLPAILGLKLHSSVVIDSITVTDSKGTFNEFGKNVIGSLSLKAIETKELSKKIEESLSLFSSLGLAPNPMGQSWFFLLKASSFFQKALFLMDASGDTDLFFSEVGQNLHLSAETIADG